MPDELLGPRLRAERERRRITLESIAANTKISLGLLRALERDDVSRWPTGIFRRSFVRAYATAIGLDPDEVLQQFLDRYPEPLEDTGGVTAPAAAEAPRRAAQAVHLRLTLDNGPQPFSAGRLLRGARLRVSAVVWDAGFNLVIALTAYIAFGYFWMPFCVSLLCYYVGSVLVVGNTPGVSLFAERRSRPRTPPAPDTDLLSDLQAGTFERLTS